MSEPILLSSELTSDDRISAGTLAYVGQRARNRYFDFILRRFRDSGLSKAQLARRLGKGQDRVGHLLASPGNWTIDTLAELLAAISAEEIVPHAEKFAERKPRNITQADLLERLAPLPPQAEWRPDATASASRAIVLEPL